MEIEGWSSIHTSSYDTRDCCEVGCEEELEGVLMRLGTLGDMLKRAVSGRVGEKLARYYYYYYYFWRDVKCEAKCGEQGVCD